MYRLRQFHRSLMISSMTGFTQCDQVVRCITACFATLYVMDIKDFVFGLTLTTLASVTVTEQHIFPDIPKV